MKRIAGILISLLSLCAVANANAVTCELKYGYYVSCSGGAGIILMNGKPVGGCSWLREARTQLQDLQRVGVCTKVVETSTDCQIPGVNCQKK